MLLLVSLRGGMSLVGKQAACSSALCCECRQLVLAKGKPLLFYSTCAGNVKNVECDFSNSVS